MKRFKIFFKLCGIAFKFLIKGNVVESRQEVRKFLNVYVFTKDELMDLIPTGEKLDLLINKDISNEPSPRASKVGYIKDSMSEG